MFKAKEFKRYSPDVQSQNSLYQCVLCIIVKLIHLQIIQFISGIKTVQYTVCRLLCRICYNYIILPRYLYWLDYGQFPMLGRSFLDGTDWKPIVIDRISNPRDLTIDIFNNDVYWVDSKLDAINKVNRKAPFILSSAMLWLDCIK